MRVWSLTHVRTGDFGWIFAEDDEMRRFLHSLLALLRGSLCVDVICVFFLGLLEDTTCVRFFERGH